MGRFLISTMPAAGHVNPLLLTAAKLVERGHEVWWHTGAEASAGVQAAGATFVPMRHTHDIVEPVREAQRKKGLAAANATMIALFVEPMLGQIHDYVEILRDFPADAIVTDMCSLGASLLHENGGPVWASVGINPLRTAESPSYGSGKLPPRTWTGRTMNRVMNWMTEHLILHGVTVDLNRRRREIRLSPLPKGTTVFDRLMSPFLHLHGTVPSFEFPYSDIPPQLHFVGAMLPPAPPTFTPPAWWDDLSSNVPIIHVTQGTVATDLRELVYPTIEGLADEELLVVVTVPEPDRLTTPASNVRVERLIPHALLLPRVDVMVTNGGYNGVKAALAHGVPVVAAGATEDKPEVCARVAQSGAGINLKTGSPGPAQVREAVLRVLREPIYRQRAKAIQSDFASHDSATESTQLLERLARTRQPVYR